MAKLIISDIVLFMHVYVPGVLIESERTLMGRFGQTHRAAIGRI
jgi:hypothetical protein